MGHARRERVAEALRDEISGLLRREIRDPRIGFVTLTGVEVSPDLTHAKVFVSVLGQDQARAASLEALNRAAGYLQREVFRRLRLKKAISLLFVTDEAVASGTRIEELLQEIHQAGADEEE